MHGSFEANNAMHDLRPDDLAWARVSTTASPAVSTPSRRSRSKIHIDIDPSSINKNGEGRPAASSAIAPIFSRIWSACGAAKLTIMPDREAALAEMVEARSSGWRARDNSFGFRQSDRDIIKPQHAIQPALSS